MTPSELRKHFLKQAAPIVDEYINAALGVKDLNSYNEEARREVWGLVKKLMISSTDRIELGGIEGPEGVIKAVESGKCTIEQGQQLLGMYKMLMGDDGEGGPLFTITINKTEEIIDGNQQSSERSGSRTRSVPVVGKTTEPPRFTIEPTSGEEPDSDS